MIRMLIQLAINIASAALGLLIAWALLRPAFEVQLSGFLLAVVIYAAVSALVGPFVFNMARKFATALLGGVGLISTLLALWIATFVPGGITISTWQGWLVGTLIVWLVTALGGWFLLWFAVDRKRAKRAAA